MPNGTFTVTIPNLSQLAAAFAQAAQVATPILQRAIAASQAILAKYTNSSTVPVRTGFLVNNWRWELAGLTGYWKPIATYAPYVEFGTGIYGPKGQPFTITARNAKALYWPGAAHPVKSVTIQGQKPNPFMERIIAAAQPDITSTFQTALEQILQQIAQAS